MLLEMITKMAQLPSEQANAEQWQRRRASSGQQAGDNEDIGMLAWREKLVILKEIVNVYVFAFSVVCSS